MVMVMVTQLKWPSLPSLHTPVYSSVPECASELRNCPVTHTLLEIHGRQTQMPVSALNWTQPF